jgi:hypothetical protein
VKTIHQFTCSWHSPDRKGSAPFTRVRRMRKLEEKYVSRQLHPYRPNAVCSLSTMALLKGPERRRKGRLKLPQTVRVRPSDAHLHDFDEILPTLNSSRESVYFASKNENYKEGLRLFITYPYSDGLGSINRESLGKVVRIDDLGNGRRGIAVEILMPIYLGGKETVR